MDTISLLRRDLIYCKSLDKDTVQRLHPKAMAGDNEAMQEMVYSLIPWALKIATNIHRSCKNGRIHIELEDLMQEACVGIIEGIKKFDPLRGYKLITYTTHHIQKSCWNYCYDSGLVRIPKYLSTKKEFLDRRVGPAFEPVLCLEPDDETLGQEETEKEGMPAEMLWMSIGLSYRDKSIMRERFFDGKTLTDIGKQRNLSKERIRQIVVESLDILREEYEFYNPA